MKHRRHWRDYRTETGRRPVRDFLMSLTTADRAVAAVRHVADAGLRAARHLRSEIWEVRVDGGHQAYRFLFASEGRYGQGLLGLEAFSKKPQKTPPAKLELAETRLKDWRARSVHH